MSDASGQVRRSGSHQPGRLSGFLTWVMVLTPISLVVPAIFVGFPSPWSAALLALLLLPMCVVLVQSYRVGGRGYSGRHRLS